MFISVKLIDYFTTTTIKLPVVNHGELRQRISDFIQKRDSKYLNETNHSHLCKKLFQNSHCELAAFPQRGLDKISVSCGDLLACALSPEKGVVLCFIPSTTKPSLRIAEIRQQFQGRNYPCCSEASTCLFSRVEISFLFCGEGMINVCINGSCTLQGLEISLLRYRNTHQTLFCRKLTSNFLIQSPSYIMGELGSDYILVDCLSREKDFCFQIGLPVFSQEEVDVKICSARQSRVAFSKLRCLGKRTYLRFMTIFPNETTHHVVSFPDPMYLSLPFGLIKKGQLLLSHTETDCILKCTSISDLFVSGKKKRPRHSINFYDWQIESPLYIQTNQSIQNITCFSDPSVTIIRKGDSKEFLLVGAQIKLLCSRKGIWGICFFKDGVSSSELQEAATLISCTKKKSNFVMEQGHSHSEQSSSKCDTEEDSSHGAKKRSAACLGLNFADQAPLCSSAHVPKKGNFKGIKKSSTQVVSLSPGPLDDPNQRPLARLTASMVKLPVDAVPLQSASLQLPNLPSFTLKKSQKTTSDSDSFGLGAGTEAFQGTISPLITTSSRFFQQNLLSITSSENISTTSSLEISSISQEATQLNENAWKAILDIINTNHSSTRPTEKISTVTSLEISSVSQESKQSNEETWEDLSAIMKR